MADRNGVSTTARARSFTWADPREVLAGIVARAGQIDWLRDMRDGKIPPPPAASLLGFEMDAVEDGRIVFAARAEEWMSNPAGVTHGGVAAAILDTVLTLALITKLPPEKTATTTDLHVHFVRPLLPDGQRFTAEGLVVHAGKTFGTSEGKVYDAKGRIVAHGTGSFAIIDVARL